MFTQDKCPWDKGRNKKGGKRLEHKSSKFMVYMCHVTCFFFPFIWSSWASQNIISVKLDVKILKEKRDFKKLLGTHSERWSWVIRLTCYTLKRFIWRYEAGRRKRKKDIHTKVTVVASSIYSQKSWKQKTRKTDFLSLHFRKKYLQVSFSTLLACDFSYQN